MKTSTDPSACNDLPVELRSLLMASPSKFYISLECFFFDRDWESGLGAPLSSSVLKRRYISLQNELIMSHRLAQRLHNYHFNELVGHSSIFQNLSRYVERMRATLMAALSRTTILNWVARSDTLEDYIHEWNGRGATEKILHQTQPITIMSCNLILHNRWKQKITLLTTQPSRPLKRQQLMTVTQTREQPLTYPSTNGHFHWMCCVRNTTYSQLNSCI